MPNPELNLTTSHILPLNLTRTHCHVSMTTMTSEDITLTYIDFLDTYPNLNHSYFLT